MKVALVSETRKLKMPELSRAAAALQKQLDEHVAPLWKISADVQAFPNNRPVPKGYWRATVRDHIEPEGAWSIHSFANGQPFVEVTFGKDWTLGVSHDVMEMLIDPQVQRIVWARSIRPGEAHDVAYMVQACDPCAASTYEIDGVKVADFSTPEYWTAAPGVKGKYSYTGALTEPREILRGGYLSWKDPRSRHYWQKVWWGDEPAYNDLGSYGSDEPPAPRQRAAKAAAPPRERRIPLQVTAFREVHRAQETDQRSAREKIEALIREFGAGSR